MYDCRVNDEYAFESKFKEKTVYTLRKITHKEIDESAKTLKIYYHQKVKTIFSQDSSAYFLPIETEDSIVLYNIDTCFFVNDLLYKNHTGLFPISSTDNNKCELVHPICTFKRISSDNDYVNLIQHDYYYGIGFLSQDNWKVFQPQYSPLASAAPFNNTETLIYVKNQFYKCGEKPLFSKYELNHHENVVEFFPNPVLQKSSLICNLANPFENKLEFIKIYNLLGQEEKAFTVPSFGNELKQFNIPYSYLHAGINILRFVFTNGHSEVHQIVVE
jgi:hypothetical protein